MADTTTRYSLPYQEGTDPPNGPTLGQELAEAVEAALGEVDDALAIVTADVDRLGIVARAHRAGNKTITTAETTLLRLDGVVMKTGYTYRFTVPRLRMDAVTTTDKVSYRLRLSTSGAATTASTIATHTEVGDQQTGIISYIYMAVADVTTSVLLTGIQYLGTSVVTHHADEDGTQIIAECLGLTVPDTGVDL